MQAGNSEHHYIGMISGTSRDGVDAALVNFHGNRVELLHAICVPYPSALRNDVDAMILQGQKPAPGKAAALDEMLGRFFAKVANDLMRQAGVERQDVTAIGSHGQTVWHEPDADLPISIQLGSGSMISRATGVTTVTDFRRADLVAGGQGAPLAPLFHRAVFESPQQARVIVNLGGIANISVIAPEREFLGYDPLRAWIRSVPVSVT